MPGRETEAEQRQQIMSFISHSMYHKPFLIRLQFRLQFSFIKSGWSLSEKMLLTKSSPADQLYVFFFNVLEDLAMRKSDDLSGDQNQAV